MAKLAIVNAPSSFTTIWSFIKPWLAKETVQKVDILGSDYQKVLLDLVDAENLPASLGGKCTCSEFGGCEKSNSGPWSEGRKERRERWLRGEGEIQVTTPAAEKEIGESESLVPNIDPAGRLICSLRCRLREHCDRRDISSQLTK